MTQAKLIDRILRSPRLPSLPTIAMEVIELVNQRDVNIKQIAHTISHDPALAGKLLRTANSAFYGQAKSISTISHALVVLGLNSVKTLALGFSLIPHLLKEARGEGFDHIAFWKRSLHSAVASRSIARRFGVIYQEEAFLCGLLQDLGMLAMSQTLGATYQEIIKPVGRDHRAVLALEREKLDVDHAFVGSMLAEHWNFPQILVYPIRVHEAADRANIDELAPLVRSVALGGRAADTYDSEDHVKAMQIFRAMAGEWFGLAAEDVRPLLADIETNSAEIRRLFDLPENEDENDRILSRANDTLTELNLQQQVQTTELEERNRTLSEQAITDSLTGIANRRRFNEFIAAEFAASTLSGKPLSLLFLDTDHFKKFNDTYGHPTGDRVLVGLAEVLKTKSPAGSLVARYGGEEFAVVLPSTPRAAAAALAQTLRLAVQECRIESDEGAPLSITISLGAACAEGGVFARAEQLMKAADQGVYAAKAAGRNCVRVFTPKPRPAGEVAAAMPAKQ